MKTARHRDGPGTAPYLSVCALYRDEAHYLREWIEFHRLVGVERFFLYNHGSVDAHRQALAPYLADGTVEVYDWPDVGMGVQVPIYNYCLNEHRDDSRWIAFIDIDEFLFSPTGRPISELLGDYEQWPAVGINWAVFGTSGHRAKPPGLVIESYLWRNDDSSGEPWNRRFKSIVDPRRAISAQDGHHFTFTEGGVVDEHQRPIDGPITNFPSFSRFRINHYWTRSEEECAGKFARPRVFDGELMMKGKGPPFDWLDRELNQKRDEAILTYAPAVREALDRVNGISPLPAELSGSARAGQTSTD